MIRTKRLAITSLAKTETIASVLAIFNVIDFVHFFNVEKIKIDKSECFVPEISNRKLFCLKSLLFETVLSWFYLKKSFVSIESSVSF